MLFQAQPLMLPRAAEAEAIYSNSSSHLECQVSLLSVPLYDRVILSCSLMCLVLSLCHYILPLPVAPCVLIMSVSLCRSVLYPHAIMLYSHVSLRSATSLYHMICQILAAAI